MEPFFDFIIGLITIAAGASGRFSLLGTNSPMALVGVGGIAAIVMWIFYSFVSGRNLKQRLTDLDQSLPVGGH